MLVEFDLPDGGKVEIDPDDVVGVTPVPLSIFTSPDGEPHPAKGACRIGRKSQAAVIVAHSVEEVNAMVSQARAEQGEC
jgi:hypothetical protein